MAKIEGEISLKMDGVTSMLTEHIGKLQRQVRQLEKPDTVIVQVRRTKTGAKMPVRATAGSSGYDVHAVDRISVHPGVTLVPTGLKFKIPPGYEIQVRPKSGLALKLTLTVLNSPGTIDSDYRGEVGVIIANHGEYEHVFEAGEKVAQIVCCKVPTVDFMEVSEDEYNRESTDNQRGAGGFGSTGK